MATQFNLSCIALRNISCHIRRHTHYFRQHVFFHTKGPNFDAIRVNMPVLSPTMENGTIVKWHKKEGDAVSPGDILCEVQTDKAVMAYDTEEEGIMAKILMQENEQVAVGKLIALIVEEGDDWKNVQVPAEEDAGESEAAATRDSASSHSQTIDSHMRGIGPAVRSLLDIYKLQPGQIQATGRASTLLKGDVLQHIKKNSLTPAPLDKVQLPSSQTTVRTPTQSSAPSPSQAMPSAATPRATQPQPPEARAPPPAPQAPPAPLPDTAFSDLPLTSMRKVIAKRLTESKTTIPHAYASIDCSMQKVLQFRKDLIKDGVKVSVNDFIIKASAVALQRVPGVNAVWRGEASAALADIDISVAVATDSGLITPIVRNASGLGLQDISNTVRDLSSRARDGKLQLQEFQGGSFTISNLGMFGITEFSAVINPPQACILAVGGSRLTLDSEGSPQTLMTVTLSADARIVDEHLATQFLDAFKAAIEEPMSMLGGTASSENRIAI